MRISLVVLLILITFKTNAEIKQSISNISFDLPNNYILTSQLDEKNYKDNNLSKKEFKTITKFLGMTADLNLPVKDRKSEFILNKDIFLNTGEHMHMFSKPDSKDMLGSIEIKEKHHDKYCQSRQEHLIFVSKNEEIKKRNLKLSEYLESKNIIQKFECKKLQVDNNIYSFMSYVEYINLANNNAIVQEAQFSKLDSNETHVLQLSCMASCNDMNKTFINIIDTLQIK